MNERTCMPNEPTSHSPTTSKTMPLRWHERGEVFRVLGWIILPENQAGMSFRKDTNGFEFSIESGRTPTIDEKVGSGQMRESSAKIFLLGGRPYPVELRSKFNDPNASIEWVGSPQPGSGKSFQLSFFSIRSLPLFCKSGQASAR